MAASPRKSSSDGGWRFGRRVGGHLDESWVLFVSGGWPSFHGPTEENLKHPHGAKSIQIRFFHTDGLAQPESTMSRGAEASWKCIFNGRAELKNSIVLSLMKPKLPPCC